MGRRRRAAVCGLLSCIAFGATATASASTTSSRPETTPTEAVSELALTAPATKGGLLGTTGTQTGSVADVANTDPPRTAPMIRLLAQGPVVTEDGTLRLDFAVESADTRPLPAGLGVAITVHRRARTRAQFRSTLSGENLGAVLGLVTPTPVSSDGRTEQFVPVELRVGPPSPACPTCIRLDNDGVYPVNVELRNLRTDDVVDRLTTHVIRTTNVTTERRRLKVALVVPLHLAPLDDPTDPVVATRSFVERVEAMAGRPLVPLSVAPTPETIEALAQRPDDPLLTQLRFALAGREVLASPYVRWSTSLFDRAQLTDELATQTRLGTDVLRKVLGIEPTPGVLIAGDRIPSAAGVSRAGINVVIAEADAVRASAGQISAAGGPVLLNLGGETPTPAKVTLVLDRDIEGELTRWRDPIRRGGEDVLRAQHILADLTMLAASRTAQGLAIQIPEDTPQATLDALLSGLGTTNPIIEPVTVSDLAGLPLQTRSEVPEVVSRVGSVPEPSSELPAGDLLAITGARSRLTGYLSLFPGPAPDESGLSRKVSRLVAIDLIAKDRSRRINLTNRAVAELLGQVRLSTPDQLTVTARNAIVPIGVINDTGLPIRVFVTVRSSSVRLRDSGVVVDAIGTTEIRQQIDVPARVGESEVAIETRGPGSFSMVARLTTPDGVALASGRYRLRSTAVSGLGTVLTLGSLVVLLVWWFRWGRSASRRSRQRHPAGRPVVERRGGADRRSGDRLADLDAADEAPKPSVHA